MKLLHLSDLHLGKRVNEFSMIEDQKYILTEILGIIDREQPDGILIAGDVYDRPTPSEEAVALLDHFLSRIAARHIETYIISGNHDSAVKLSFASGLIDASGIHFAPAYHGQTPRYDRGPVSIYLLPFVKPAVVRAALIGTQGAEEIHTYTEAVQAAIDHMQIDPDRCNILVAHQFVAGASQCESEENVGGLDAVDAAAFEAFDYVALGHIHGPQSVSRETIRYSGTPLKYSFSEAAHQKSVTRLKIDDQGQIVIDTIPLSPLHDMRKIRGTFEELMSRETYEGTHTDDYIHAELTDEEDIVDAIGRLRTVYPNIMRLSYDNKRTRGGSIERSAKVDSKSPMELCEEFFEQQNAQPMSEEQRSYLGALLEEIREERV